MRAAQILVFAFGLLLSTACHYKHISVGGFDVAERGWEEAEPQLRRKAIFDLECDDVDLQILNTRGGGWPKYLYATSVGVTGCGKRVRYERVGSEWVMNHAAEAEK